MKKLITLLMLLLTLVSFGQTEAEIIKRAKDQIANKKYETAFKLLDEFDPMNSKPDIVLLKESILLNYFVNSIMHQMFALKDLEKNEDILDYKGKPGSFGMQFFPIDSILENLIKVHPTNCKLYKGLGEFYYEVHLKYSGHWIKNDQDLFIRMEKNFQKATEGNCADYLSYYVLGYVQLVQDKFKESIPYFLKSIELNRDYASSHYNLAYAYIYTKDKQNALKYAKNSLGLYTDQTYKSDAARMIGQIYSELKDDENALKNYELADKISPRNYYNIKAMLELYVKTDNAKSLETAKAFLNLDPSNPSIYNDLEVIYYTYKKEGELAAFYKSQLSTFKEKDPVLGNLNFYLGRIFIDTDKKTAREYFTNAREIFSKIYTKEHQVFNVIEEGIKRCEE